MAAKESTIIRIDEDLYARLRRHCDRERIRFLDFVENSLEDALSRETVTEVLADELESLRGENRQVRIRIQPGPQAGFRVLVPDADRAEHAPCGGRRISTC